MLTPYERQMIADALDPACAWLSVLFPEIPEFNMNQDGGRRDELIELVLTKCRDRLVIWLRRLRNLGGYAELIAIRYGGTDIVSEETFAQAQLPIEDFMDAIADDQFDTPPYLTELEDDWQTDRLHYALPYCAIGQYEFGHEGHTVQFRRHIEDCSQCRASIEETLVKELLDVTFTICRVHYHPPSQFEQAEAGMVKSGLIPGFGLIPSDPLEPVERLSRPIPEALMSAFKLFLFDPLKPPTN